MTLVEVIAGLALLGSLLVAILLAKGRYTKQWARAAARRQAIVAADALLSEWWRTPDVLRSPDTGRVEGQPLAWRRTLVHSTTAAELKMQVVRLEVFDDRAGSGSEANGRVTVDVVVPTPASER
jgi:hypothetical protein